MGTWSHRRSNLALRPLSLAAGGSRGSPETSSCEKEKDEEK